MKHLYTSPWRKLHKIAKGNDYLTLPVDAVHAHWHFYLVTFVAKAVHENL